jgi:hypothetical protein
MPRTAPGVEAEFAERRAESPEEDCRAQRPARSGASRALELARAGDRSAAGFLYARYGDDVYACIRPMVYDHERAAWITRRVFASLRDSSEWPQPRLISPRGWLLARARQIAGDDAIGEDNGTIIPSLHR